MIFCFFEIFFENIRVNKKEFHKSKQPVGLASVNVDQIVKKTLSILLLIKKGEIVKPLCIILPQMNGYIKYFENSSKNMSFFY